MKKEDFWILLFISVLGYVIFMSKNEISNYVEEKISGINNSFDDIFKKMASKTGVSARVIKAISANESSVGQNNGTEKIGDTKGVMHLIYDTAVRFSPGLKPGDHKNLPVEKDIEIGAKYLNFLLKRYGNIQHAVMAYNGGEGRMDQIIAYQKSKTFKPIRNGDTLERMQAAHKNMTTYWDRYQRNFNKLGIA